MMRIAFGLIVAGALSACATGPVDPDAEKIEVVSDGTRFSGTAGSAFSDERLQSEVFSTICASGQRVDQLRITRTGLGGAVFSGVCVS